MAYGPKAFIRRITFSLRRAVSGYENDLNWCLDLRGNMNGIRTTLLVDCFVKTREME